MKVGTVVVATDFSPAAGAAVDYAADLARHFEARLVLVHAYAIDLPVATRGACHQRVQQPRYHVGNFLNRPGKSLLVGLGGFGEPAHLADKLQGGGANLIP